MNKLNKGIKLGLILVTIITITLGAILLNNLTTTKTQAKQSNIMEVSAKVINTNYLHDKNEITVQTNDNKIYKFYGDGYAISDNVTLTMNDNKIDKAHNNSFKNKGNDIKVYQINKDTLEILSTTTWKNAINRNDSNAWYVTADELQKEKEYKSNPQSNVVPRSPSMCKELREYYK